MKNYKVTEEKYQEVKRFLGANLKVKQIVTLCGLSTATITRIGQSSDLQDYLQIQRDNFYKYHNKAKVVQEKETEKETPKPSQKLENYFDTMIDQNRQMIGLLTEMVNMKKKSIEFAMNKRKSLWGFPQS